MNKSSFRFLTFAARPVILFFCPLFLLTSLPVLLGEQWPVERENLEKVFGCDNGTGMNLSLNFSNSGVVHPFKEGEAVFLLLEENSSIPYNIGDSVVVEHKRDFRSYYTGLNRKISPVMEKKNLDTETVIGLSDETGIYIKDMKSDCFVNLLPLLPHIERENSLELKSVKINGVNGEFELKSGGVYPAGEYTLLLDAQEVFTETVTGVPYKTGVYIQGQEVLRSVYDMIEPIDGRFRLSGNLQQGYNALYGTEGYYSPGYIRLISGRTTLTLELTDLRGNKIVRNLEFTVSD